MQILPANDPATIETALEILRAGGIVAHATETCYGLACDMRNEGAVKKLFLIKNRPENMPVSALFPSVEEAKKYVEWNEEAENLAREHLPGPLTLILNMRHDAPTLLYPISTSPTLGLRISSHPLAQQLVTSFGFPISTTSANLHGQPNPYSTDDSIAQFQDRGAKPDLILDSGTLPQNPPSTVIDLTKGGEVLRKGSVGKNH